MSPTCPYHDFFRKLMHCHDHVVSHPGHASYSTQQHNKTKKEKIKSRNFSNFTLYPLRSRPAYGHGSEE